MYFFLIQVEEARCLAVVRNLSSEGQIADVFECRLEPIEIVSAELETPEVILGVPWALPLIMVRGCIQWSSKLQVISRDRANDVGIGSHNHPSVPCRNAPPPVVSDDAGYMVNPAIEIEA